MKIRTGLIITASIAALGVGAFMGVKAWRASRTEAVKVVEVASVNESAYNSDGSTIYGSVVYKDSQSVSLKTDYALQEVYVEEGDTVRKGDLLLSYDSTLPELKAELAELNRQLLELELSREERELAKLNYGVLPAAYFALEDSREKTASADGQLFVLGGQEDGAVFSGEQGEGGVFSQEQGEGALFLQEQEDGTYFSQEQGDSGVFAAEQSGSSVFPAEQEDAQELFFDSGEQTVFDQDETGDRQKQEQEIGEGWIVDGGDWFSEDAGFENGADLPSGSDTKNGSEKSGELIFEDGPDSSGDDAAISEEEDGSSGEESSLSALDRMSMEEASRTVEMLSGVNQFFSLVNLLRSQEADDINPDNLSLALTIFRTRLSSEESTYLKTFDPDMFGERRIVKVYMLSKELTESGVVTEDVQEYLYQGYIWLCLYDYLAKLEALEASLPEGMTAEEMDESELERVKAPLQEAVNAYYAYLANARRFDSGSENLAERELGKLADELYEAYIAPSVEQPGGTVLVLAGRIFAWLMETPLLYEREKETEAVTEGWNDGEDEGDEEDPGADSEEEMTPQERAEAIDAALMGLREIKLQLREADLEIAKWQRELDSLQVTAAIDGTVKTAGTVDGGGSSNEFIIIAGGQGMYARGTVSETDLDSVMVGDVITGTLLEDYSTQFTATITEISSYPDSRNNNFWGVERANTSYYPFYAYIEDGDSLPEGECELVLAGKENDQDLIWLPMMLVRTDESGKSYVMIRGDDQLLKKQHVKTGKTMGSYAIQILSGLSNDDFIAVPYGKEVQPGAKTVEADSFYGDSYYSYG